MKAIIEEIGEGIKTVVEFFGWIFVWLCLSCIPYVGWILGFLGLFVMPGFFFMKAEEYRTRQALRNGEKDKRPSHPFPSTPCHIGNSANWIVLAIAAVIVSFIVFFMGDSAANDRLIFFVCLAAFVIMLAMEFLAGGKKT